MQQAVEEAVRNLINNPAVKWVDNELNWEKVSNTGITFNVPDSTPDNSSDNKRAAILSVDRSGDTINVETTRGNYSFNI